MGRVLLPSIALDVIATLRPLIAIEVFRSLLSELSIISTVNPVNCVKEPLPPPPLQDEDIPATKKPRLEEQFPETIDHAATETVSYDATVAAAANLLSPLLLKKPQLQQLFPTSIDALTTSPKEVAAHRWTAGEDAQLANAVKNDGKNWVAVASLLQGIDSSSIWSPLSAG